jgi:hypothetical protein
MNKTVLRSAVLHLELAQSHVLPAIWLLVILMLYSSITRAQANPTTTQYQAAASGNTLVGNAAVASCAGCVGGLKVGSLGYGSAIIFNNVAASTTGNYTLTIVGCEGAGTQDYQVIVDNGAPVTVPLSGNNWYAAAPPVSITVTLQAGNNNTIELGNATNWSPDVVSIAISPAVPGSTTSVTSITPNQLPITGGKVTIIGTNFTADTTVTFGGIAAGPITLQNSTQFTVNAPASPTAGTVNVVVTSPANGSATVTGGFTYVEPTPCQSSTCVYQAWDPQNTLSGGAAVASCIGCPYGEKVGSLGYGSAVTINHVYAPADGQYLLTIVGCEGSGTQQYQVVADGGNPITVPLFGNNWYLATPPVATVVSLKAGSGNTIQIGNTSTWSPDVVYIAVSPANVATTTPEPEIIEMSSGRTQVRYDLSTGLASFSYDGAEKIASFYSQAYNGYTLYRSIASNYRRTAQRIGDEETDITLKASDGSPTMIQRFIVRDHYALVQVELKGANLSSNEMSPIVVNQSGAVDLGEYGDTRFLQVPFDNDAFYTYNAAASNGLSTTGYEVGAFYDNTSRSGLIIGSVSHDVWKTGIAMTGNNNRLDSLSASGGANSPWDQLPHASVRGNLLSSPLVMVGYYSDWRDGMENFAEVSSQITPKAGWNGPAPVGWGTLGNNETNLTYALQTEAADYFHTKLPQFNNHGVSYMNFDAFWTNLTDDQLQAYVNHVHSQGQKAGIYWTPWVVWDWTPLTNALDGAPAYTVNDVVMKDHNGNPIAAIDSAWGVDPTHPGVRERINYYITKFKGMGFDYIKLDFLSHGMLEGGAHNGVHYDQKVRTGVQAYNAGMSYLYQQIGGSMFIDESIAPLFPYQYANARRVSCDTYGAIGDTSYEMNSESYGWWLAGRLYGYNDPDEIHLEGYTLNENKSRVTSTAVSGYLLDGDDVTDSVAPALVQEWLTNPNINLMPSLQLHFRPVEGNTGTSPVNVMVAERNGGYFIAVFNYDGSNPANESVDLGRAGLDPSRRYQVTDLWTGKTSSASGTLNLSLNPAESTIVYLRGLF